MTKKRFPFSRRAFLVQGLALLAGCRSLPNLPPLPFHDREEDGENAPLLNVGGEVSEIRTTHNWRFMAVRSRTRNDDAAGTGAPMFGTNLSLYNIEFQRPLPCPEFGFDTFENPAAVAFTPKAEACYVVSGASDYGPGAGNIAVDRIPLAPPKKEKIEPFHLEDPDWIDAFLGPAGDWQIGRAHV